jgi:hypothetical protein
MATESLLNLTLGQGIFFHVTRGSYFFLELNQSVVTRTGVIPVILQNALDTTEHQTKYENLFLLLNLARCGIFFFFEVILTRFRSGKEDSTPRVPRATPDPS